jgi:hypothetical protein
LTDYAAANDMLAKLCNWLRHHRPDCAAVCFHWQTWDKIGMAAIADGMSINKSELSMEFIPPEENVRHLHEEMLAGGPESEILISDGYFQRMFYPHEVAGEKKPAASGPAPTAEGISTAGRPLIAAVEKRHDGSLEAKVLFDPETDPFLRHHRLRGKPILPGMAAVETLAEAAALWKPGATVVGLRDVEIVNALMFQGQPVAATVSVSPVEGGLACTLSSELRDRKHRLIQADRLHAKAIVELGDRPPDITTPPPGQPHAGWFPNRYPDDALLYHGAPLRYLKQCFYQYDGGWGKIIAPPLAELAGPRSASGWIFPVAVLDACVVTCGSFVFLQFGGQLEVPHGFARLRIVRQPNEGETCVVRVYFRGRTDKHSTFDFTLFGEDNSVVLEAQGYRTILVGEGAS